MKFVLTDIDYRDSIRLFGETVEGKRVVVKDKEFKPYFFVEGGKAKEIEKIRIEDHEVLKVEKEGNRLKVTVNEPSAVPVIGDEIKAMGGKPVEKDIPFTQRYLLDKGLKILNGVDSETFKKCEVEWKPRILAFDIETSNKKGVPDSSIDEVLMISLWSNYGIKKVLLTKPYDEGNTESFNDEKEMLKAFNKVIKETKPSIIVTYNGDMFDWPFLRDRMNNYNIRRDYGYDGSSMTIINRRMSSSARIKGMAHIDLYVFVAKILSANLKTSSLDLGSVSEELIDNTKKEMDWDVFYENWQDGYLEKIVDYSLTDAKVTYELFDKLKHTLFELVRLVNQPLYETCRSSYSGLVENYLINKAKEMGETVPHRPKGDKVMARRRATFTGGYVHEPKAGIYEKIAVVDFRSLYPTIIVSYNIGPGTIGKKGLKVKTNGKTHEFGQKKTGFIPSVVKELVEKRAKIKKELKKKKDPLLEAESYAVKTITNATYGYLSYPRSRWYCFGCNESIAALGRKHIKDVIKKAEQEGFGVCYGDTDSAFLTLGNKSEKDLKVFLDKINKELPGIMELELERVCPRGLFVAGKKGEKGVKKRYALIDKQGELIIKGFEFVRGDWSNISKETQYKVFQALLKDNDQKKAINEVKKVIKALRENKVPLKDLVIRTQLTRDLDKYKSIGPHVAVAQRLAKKGYPISAGTMISYIVTEGKGLIRDKSRTVEEVEQQKLKPDAEYYINNQVIPAVDRVLDVLEVSKDEVKSDKKQEKLKRFF
jgi:DNA polymerase elongation subunit (family B)